MMEVNTVVLLLVFIIESKYSCTINISIGLPRCVTTLLVHVQ